MYWIKDFGADLSGLRFHRVPKVIARAREIMAGRDVEGFLICALDKPPQMTGLLFCDYARGLPEGLPIRTPPIRRRYRSSGYEMVVADDGGVYVIAHWLYENGALDRFDRVH
ncbi:hypothetical protein [Pseudomonas sp.]|uniref:hypothetical protein n=1 Tax=Pseudomonas sp. TaxID=306 RepID=UPI0028A6C67D|nr:hypothetical protein [Pseudomonas sp.]